jgi:hypothetical protein
LRGIDEREVEKRRRSRETLLEKRRRELCTERVKERRQWMKRI